jgi:hypothetical protein
MTLEQVCVICERFDNKLPILQKGEICVNCALLFAH